MHPGQADQVQKPCPSKGLVRVAADVTPLAQQQGLDHGLGLSFGKRMAQQPRCSGACQPTPQADPCILGAVIRHLNRLSHGDRCSHKDVSQSQILGEVELAGIGRLLEPVEPAIRLDVVTDLEIGDRLIHLHANGPDNRLPAGRSLDLIQFQVEGAGWVGRHELGKAPVLQLQTRLGQDMASNRRENAVRTDHAANIPRVRSLVGEQTNGAETGEAQPGAIGE